MVEEKKEPLIACIGPNFSNRGGGPPAHGPVGRGGWGRGGARAVYPRGGWGEGWVGARLLVFFWRCFLVFFSW